MAEQQSMSVIWSQYLASPVSVPWVQCGSVSVPWEELGPQTNIIGRSTEDEQLTLEG